MVLATKVQVIATLDVALMTMFTIGIVDIVVVVGLQQGYDILVASDVEVEFFTAGYVQCTAITKSHSGLALDV